MRSRIARGDDYFPELENDCVDGSTHLTTPLWREARSVMILPSRLAERKVKQLAVQAVRALKHGSYAALAQQVDSRGLCMRASKGGFCVQLTAADVANCRKFFSRSWAIDSGSDDPFPGTCHQTVRGVFMAQDFTKPTSLSFSCFPGLRGNNGAAIVDLEMPASAYAEFLVLPSAPITGGQWRALRLGYATDGGKPRLVEIISEYWGI